MSFITDFLTVLVCILIAAFAFPLIALAFMLGQLCYLLRAAWLAGYSLKWETR